MQLPCNHYMVLCLRKGSRLVRDRFDQSMGNGGVKVKWKNLETRIVGPMSGLVDDMLQFLAKSTDPFHAVEQAAQMLTAHGFQKIHTHDQQPHTLEPGGKYFYTKHSTRLVAFTLGKLYKPGNGLKIFAAHTDSPILKVKPRSKRVGPGQTVQLDVECYGGGLWHTWFDRDLSLSGRVLVRNQQGIVEQRLVRIERPLLRVPTLCIHLQTAKEREAFVIGKEDHLQPILAMATKRALEETSDDSNDWATHQEPKLLSIVADELGVAVNDIADFELNLYDTQGPTLSGADREFLHSARLDNLCSCFLGVKALATFDTTLDSDISLVALFDHEEVGSNSAVGAGSPIMSEAVSFVTRQVASQTDVSGAQLDSLCTRAISKSFVLSVDMAHAVHPNYASKHEKSHGPILNKGLVIKYNSNQRYATNSLTAFVVREIARHAGLTAPQDFVVRNDCPCGSTIGPIIATNTGIRAVDVGLPQLSMHSIREQMGTMDIHYGYEFFIHFFKKFRDIDDGILER